MKQALAVVYAVRSKTVVVTLSTAESARATKPAGETVFKMYAAWVNAFRVHRAMTLQNAEPRATDAKVGSLVAVARATIFAGTTNACVNPKPAINLVLSAGSIMTVAAGSLNAIPVKTHSFAARGIGVHSYVAAVAAISATNVVLHLAAASLNAASAIADSIAMIHLNASARSMFTIELAETTPWTARRGPESPCEETSNAP